MYVRLYVSRYVCMHVCMHVCMYIGMYVCKGKAIPLQARTGPESSRRLRLPYFETIGTWRWSGCQPYSSAAFTPQELYLILISVRCGVDPWAIVWPEGLCQRKIPMTVSGIEPATFRLIAQCLNQQFHWVPPCMYVYEYVSRQVAYTFTFVYTKGTV